MCHKEYKMICVYIQKWNKEDALWQRILADILKKDYGMENCPKILKNENINLTIEENEFLTLENEFAGAEIC